MVYAASSSAYGNQPGFPRLETMAPHPISPYAVQKLTGELYMQSFRQVYGIETVCLRYFNIFGPRQVPDSPYSGVMARVHPGDAGRGARRRSSATVSRGRDFTYIDNAVQANLLAATAPAERCAGRVFNVACGERHTLNETYAALAEGLGFGSPARYGPPRAGDVRDSLADITQARERLGYNPRVGFRDGLARTMEWLSQQILRRKAGSVTQSLSAEIQTSTTLQEFLDRVENRTAHVGIVGLGYVGLPLTLLFSEDRFRITGLDIDPDKVATLNAGRSYIHRIEPEHIREGAGVRVSGPRRTLRRSPNWTRC